MGELFNSRNGFIINVHCGIHLVIVRKKSEHWIYGVRCKSTGRDRFASNQYRVTGSWNACGTQRKFGTHLLNYVFVKWYGEVYQNLVYKRDLEKCLYGYEWSRTRDEK